MTLPPFWRRLLSYLLIVSLSVAIAVQLGKDHNWDSLSYHLYAGYSAIEGRIGADYFAASNMAYLNPYSHVPFYLMVRAALAPQAIVALLALFQCLNLLIVYEMAARLNRRADGTVAWPAVFVAVVLALVNPIFLLELGNTFNEISTCVPVLAGWYLLVRHFETLGRGPVLLAGLLLGIAAALKLTNLMFCITPLPLLLCAPLAWRARLHALLWFAAGGLLGAVLAGGWWAWQLWELFGNPFFPMFNSVFQSPEFPVGTIRHFRFLPGSLGELLAKPFLMALPVRGIHLETAAPDIRYAALCVLTLAFGAKYALARRQRWWQGDPLPAYRDTRLLLALGASFVLAWAVWSVSSGNGRYFLPMACVGAVLLVSLLFRFSARPRSFFYLVAPLVLVQAGMSYTSELRWTGVVYGNAWFELDVPARMRTEPTLYLHMSSPPASFLMPYLAPASHMINISGVQVVEENAKTRALFARHAGKIRVMRRDSDPKYETRFFNYSLARFGLEVDLGDCEQLRFRLRGTEEPATQTLYYLSCATRPRQWTAQERADFAARRQRASAVFDQLELVCPHLFQPRGLGVDGELSFWRNYGNTDTLLQQYGSGLVTYRNVFTHSQDVAVGQIEDLAKAVPARANICP